jgi:membrane associated rhomboid family serine protease
MHDDHRDVRYSFLPGTLFVGLMWYVFGLAQFFEANLTTLGLYPRRVSGLLGIITTPLIHGDLMHLLSNSFPLLLLPAIMLISYPRLSVRVFVWTYLLTGLGVWFFSRPAYHVGASGIVYGLASFVFFSGVFRRDRGAVALSLIIIFLYGSMIYGLFPSEERISWESHVIGGVIGMVLAFWYRHVDRPEPEPEVEEEEEEETWIPYQLGALESGPVQHPLPENQTSAGTDQGADPALATADPDQPDHPLPDEPDPKIRYIYVPRNTPEERGKQGEEENR